ncbi:hypothetical protein, partial [Massilia aquatica]|uniref:hypothetical protein n=1 Tax=Massilia aquatica TaxID=2609000 RepID=UPI001A7EA9D1
LAKHGEAAFADADRMEGSSSSFDKFTSSPFGLHQFLPRRLLADFSPRTPSPFSPNIIICAFVFLTLL